LLSRVPDALRFGHARGNGARAAKSFDWTREPVLQSMHDDRKRIYVATRTLFETSALKGEIIIYPPGATCPAHHHEGAEHYQYVVRGAGIAVIDGLEQPLGAGDVLYNLENEQHWFRNDADEDFIFVEYFVPGTCRTVWAPGADICEWLPTGADIMGREPSRHIPQHSHGDGTSL
jgi:quercetin dioxygenase-like cupin family protein